MKEIGYAIKQKKPKADILNFPAFKLCVYITYSFPWRPVEPGTYSKMSTISVSGLSF